METTSTLEILLALAAILGSFGTAIGTFAATRNQIKQTDFGIKNVDKTAAIETAEKINEMTLRYAEKLERQLQDCNQKKDTLDDKLDEIIKYSVEVKIRAHDLVSELRRVIDKHDRVGNKDCPGYTIINQMLEEIIAGIERDINKE